MLPEYPRFVLRFFFGALCWQERVPGIRAPETCHRGYYVLSAKEGGVSCLVRSKPVDLDDDDDDDDDDDKLADHRGGGGEGGGGRGDSARTRRRMRRRNR